MGENIAMIEGGMVIIGGGMAGSRAIIGLREHGWQGDITLISEEAHLPYDRPPLSKAAILGDAEPTPTLLMDDSIIGSLKARFIGSNAAVGIDRAAKTVQLHDGTKVHYEKLLLATGAKPRPLPVPGGERAILLRDFEDSVRLRQEFRPGRRIAIIGGGFIGLELAAAARKKGCTVVLIEALPRILTRGVPLEVAEVVHKRHVEAGVTMLTGTGVASIDESGVTLTDGRKIEADVVIAGIGAIPEVTLAKQAGLAIENGIACDAGMRTSDPNIFAAGDCCSFPHQGYGGKRIRLEAWRNAQDNAAIATRNMLGGEAKHAAIPWFWSDQYDLSLQIAGMPGDGASTVKRQVNPTSFVIFHLDANGRLVGASGVGIGNAMARDIKMAEMLMAKGINPPAEILADPAVQLRSLLKA
jgi:3-phenylpropionate/trans-cinnamate dioxygenase ferredoxin reductase subunit